MNKPSISDVLTKVDTLHEAMMSRFDNVERTLAEHSVALLELSTVASEHSVLLQEHSVLLRQHSGALHELSGSFARMERRQRSETRALDDHEGRIRGLERRRSGSSPAP
jgi:hypothetical protein